MEKYNNYKRRKDRRELKFIVPSSSEPIEDKPSPQQTNGKE